MKQGRNVLSAALSSHLTAESVTVPMRELAPSCHYSAREMARALGISERHLQRIFSSALAQSPQVWLNRLRLTDARQMLPKAHSVKEVAFALGFRSASQFSRDFRLEFGVSPSQLLAAHLAARDKTTWTEGASLQLARIALGRGSATASALALPESLPTG